jgi:PAS domain-containing protein
LSADIISQISLMQSVVIQLPNVESIMAFTCKGLLDLPGVFDAQWIKEPDGCQETLGEGSLQVYCIEKGSSSFGELRLKLDRRDLFLPYESYLRNYLTMIAVVLSERRERKAKEELQRELEHLVEARTLELEKEIKEREKTEFALKQSSFHFQAIYQNAEASIRDEDLSGLYQELENLRENGVEDLQKYLEDYPEKVMELAHRVRILDVNDYSLQLYAAHSKEEFLERYIETMAMETQYSFRQLLLAIWEKREFFSV